MSGWDLIAPNNNPKLLIMNAKWTTPLSDEDTASTSPLADRNSPFPGPYYDRNNFTMLKSRWDMSMKLNEKETMARLLKIRNLCVLSE